MKHTIVLLTIILIIPLLSKALELSPGECVNFENNTICAENVTFTIDKFEVCSEWITNNITNSYGNISSYLEDIFMILDDYNKGIISNISDYYDYTISFVSNNTEGVRILNNYTMCLDEVSSKELTLKKCNDDLSGCELEKNKLDSRVEVELSDANDQKYLFGAIGLIAGAGGLHLYNKKNVPEGKDIQTREGKRGL